MTEDFFTNSEPAWISNKAANGAESCVTQLSSVRVRRNLEGFPFPGKCTKPDLYDSAAIALGSIGKNPLWGECDFRRIDDLDDFSRRLLLEMNAITPDFIKGGAGRFVLRDSNHRITCMINEEDHISISVTDAGLNLSAALETAKELEQSMDIKLARDAVLGYLTANPLYAGAGMTATVILHLPALDVTGEFSRINDAFARDWRGLELGRFSVTEQEKCGSFYAVSNKTTLSVTPYEITDHVNQGVQSLISKELFARYKISKTNHDDLTDRIWRAWGLLSHAKKLSYAEALDAFSKVKLGADIGVLPGIDDREWRRMIISSQKYHLSRSCAIILEQKEELYARAVLFRQFIKNLSSSTN